MIAETGSQEARYMAQYQLFEIAGYLKISSSLPLTLMADEPAFLFGERLCRRKREVNPPYHPSPTRRNHVSTKHHRNRV